MKSAGNLVASNLAPLISAMLEATQAAEGQSLNYLSVRLGNQVATQEKLDLARISAAKSSSLYETVQHVICCIALYDKVSFFDAKLFRIYFPVYSIRQRG